MANKCGVCKEGVSREKIVCFGICEMQFHMRCIGLNSNALKVLNESSNIKYMCDVCLKSSSRIILSKVNEVMDHAKIENKNTEDQQNKISEIEKNIEEIKCIVKKNEDTLRGLKNFNNNKEAKLSYANIIKNNASDSVVLIVPKNNKQSSEVTKNVVKEKMGPTPAGVNGLKSVSNGAVLVQCKTNESVEQIKKIAYDNLGDSYEVKIPEKILPKIRVSGISEKMSNEEIVENIRRQNEFIKAGSLKVLFISDNGRYNGFSAVIEVDGDNFKNIIENQKINIGWNKCFVNEYIHLKICYKCCGYNHKANECTRKKSCKKCAGDHDVKECNEQNSRCVNCISVNKRLELNFDFNHVARSVQCKVHLRKLEIERKKIKYSI